MTRRPAGSVFETLRAMGTTFSCVLTHYGIPVEVGAAGDADPWALAGVRGPSARTPPDCGICEEGRSSG